MDFVLVTPLKDLITGKNAETCARMSHNSSLCLQVAYQAWHDVA